MRWFSYLVLFGLGASLYPQAIQRIYAARDSRSLRTSLAAMAFLPIATAWVAVMIGITGAAHHPNLSDIQSDQILTIICRDIQQSSLFGYSLVVVLFAAILGALMSTADSCMLTLSSIVTKDFLFALPEPTSFGTHPHNPRENFILVGRRSSFGTRHLHERFAHQTHFGQITGSEI